MRFPAIFLRSDFGDPRRTGKPPEHDLSRWPAGKIDGVIHSLNGIELRFSDGFGSKRLYMHLHQADGFRLMRARPPAVLGGGTTRQRVTTALAAALPKTQR